MKRWLAAVCAVAICAFPTVAAGLTMTEVAAELRCVTCETPLDVSNSQLAQRMKAQIVERIAEGATKEQIKAEFVKEFGPEVLATPAKSGFDLLAWLVPGLAVLIGLAAVPIITRSWKSRRPATASETPELSPEDASLIERELDRFGDG